MHAKRREESAKVRHQSRSLEKEYWATDNPQITRVNHILAMYVSARNPNINLDRYSTTGTGIDPHIGTSSHLNAKNIAEY